MGKPIDDLDKQVILQLQGDARRPFREIAKKVGVSEGTVRNRVNRLIDQGILKLEARVDPFALPHKISALVGVSITGRESDTTMADIERMPYITSVWNATGRYDLFFEVMVDSLEDLNDILFRRILRDIKGISKTETFVTLCSKTKYFKLF